MVVVLHVSGYEYLSDTAGYTTSAVNFWEEVNDLFAAARMPALFIISGWLAATSMERGFGYARTRKRILTNTWLMVLWTGIYALVTVALRAQDTPNTVVPSTALVNLVLPDSTLWFLYALVWYTVLLTALRRLPHAVVVVGLLALSAYTITYWSTETGLWVKLPQFGVFFALGAYTKPFFGWVARNPLIAIPAGLVGTVLGMRWQTYQSVHQEWGYFSFLLIALSLPVLLYGLCGWLTSAVPRLCAPLTAVGRNTISLYVLHFPLLLVLIHIQIVHEVVLVMLENELVQWLWPLACTVGLAALSLVIKRRIDASWFAWLFSLPRVLARRIEGIGAEPKPAVNAADAVLTGRRPLDAEATGLPEVESVRIPVRV